MSFPQLTPSVSPDDSPPASNPALSHRLKHTKSILALALSSTSLFAGTEGGEILVFSLDTYQRVACIDGHGGSVLALHLSKDEQLLFSSAGDRFVNVWNPNTFERLYSIYSTYDVGDIFCVAYSPAFETVYMGAQNTSIQWYDLKTKDRRRPDPTTHPFNREDRFFDSLGPGGVRTPRPEPEPNKGGEDLEIDRQHIHQFAHYGYVYCMLLARGDNDEEVLISGGGDGAIRIWKLGDGIRQLHKLDDGREEGESVLSLALDGTFLYSGRLNGEVNAWDLETRQLVRSLRTHSDDVLALSVGGGFLYCAGITGIVEKFNRQYERTARFQAHDGRILASAYSAHQGRPLYVTGGNDNTISVWDIEDCETSDTHRTSNEKLVESLKQLVSYRTVSSDYRYQADCRRGASHLRAVFKNFGAHTTMLAAENPAWNPIILAKFKGNPATVGERKKILFYGHYDVIPAEKGKWVTDPFTMEGINDYLYGRGTSDNKGPLLAAIYAVADLVAEKALDSDILFLVEGEEECGSRGFEAAVRKNKHLIGDVDYILLANSYWLDDHAPCLTYGLRGVIHATVQIDSPHPDLHSGVDGSSLLDESLKDLVMLLARLTGRGGRVNIPGFYDPILPLTADEQALYDEITHALLARNPALGDPDVLGETLKRRWREASLTIHRFHTSGPSNSTIIPRTARAAISLRLVPNQTAQSVAQTLVSYLEKEFADLGSKNALSVSIDHIAEPWLGDWRGEIFQTLDKAVVNAWFAGPDAHRRRSSVGVGARSGAPASDVPPTSSTLAEGSAAAEETGPETATAQRPLYIREGGSIPAIRFLEKEFGAPAAQMPCGQASDSAHLDNERLRLVNLFKARDVFRYVFRELPKK
ncbi:glutathione degradosome [Trichodelitschia bisporula]|uniref:Glutathione degradosome n=1 Tax=Trichodelitschia bisporula TaxID=703511 RepID=A0A6G1HLR3_9PEZI|nr:glutathione degradosome [Trichodelitschia bisporula]